MPSKIKNHEAALTKARRQEARTLRSRVAKLNRDCDRFIAGLYRDEKKAADALLKLRKDNNKRTERAKKQTARALHAIERRLVILEGRGI